jgi:hypothetical protein
MPVLARISLAARASSAARSACLAMAIIGAASTDKESHDFLQTGDFYR